MPSKGKVQLNVLLTERVDTRIRVVAEVDGDSVSVAVEKAVTAYVEERAADPEWRTKHEAWKQDQQEKIRAL